MSEAVRVPHREFRALEAWHELSRGGKPRELTTLLRIVLRRDDVRRTTDPLRDAACLESAALEDYRAALFADRGSRPSDKHRADVLLRSCDELLAHSAELVNAAVEQGHRALIPAVLLSPDGRYEPIAQPQPKVTSRGVARKRWQDALDRATTAGAT